MDTRLRRTLSALLIAAALAAAGVTAPAGAESERSGPNVAEAINRESGSSIFDFAFSLREVAGSVVDETNAAVAYSSCENCQTVAIALQIVLVTGEELPTTVTPTNVAIAINEGCVTCQTLALAYQFVVGRGGPVRFTGAGRRELAHIRNELRALGRSDLSVDEIARRAEELRRRVRDVLATEIVPRGPRDEEPEVDEDREADEESPKAGEGTPGEPRGEGTAPATAPEPAPEPTGTGQSPPATAPEPQPQPAP